jgi:hypothetical protein
MVAAQAGPAHLPGAKGCLRDQADFQLPVPMGPIRFSEISPARASPLLATGQDVARAPVIAICRTLGRQGGTLRTGGRVKVTDIDSRAEIGFSYHDGDRHVVIPLADRVSQMWCQRYETLARARDVQVRVHENRGGPARLYMTVPVRASGSGSGSGSEVTAMLDLDLDLDLDLARALLAEADAVDASPDASASPEAVVRTRWASQRA